MHPVPGFYDAVTNSIGVLVLLVEFGMLRQALLRDQIRLYAVQSLVVVVLALVIGVVRGLPDLYVVAGFSFAVKVVAVPLVMMKLVHGGDDQIAVSRRLGLPTAVLVALVVTGFGYFATMASDIGSVALPPSALGLSVAAFLVGFWLMVVRTDVVSQAVGLFSLENGVSLATLVIAAGLPVIIEVALLFDLLLAVVVVGVLIRVHHHRAKTLSTRSLTRLRG